MAFATKVFPELKAKYIDTGKVRFIFREFPLDARAFAASMLARCAGPDKAFSLVEALFHTQADWAFVKENPTPKLFEIAKQAGFTQESFDKCLTDQKLLEQLTAIKTRGDEVFGINATPTFFINGKRLQAAPDARGVRQGSWAFAGAGLRSSRFAGCRAEGAGCRGLQDA